MKKNPTLLLEAISRTQELQIELAKKIAAFEEFSAFIDKEKKRMDEELNQKLKKIQEVSEQINNDISVQKLQIDVFCRGKKPLAENVTVDDL